MSLNQNALKQAMLAQGFKPRAYVSPEHHTYAGHEVDNFLSFGNPHNTENDLTIWSVTAQGTTRLFYSTKEDLDTHPYLDEDCEGAVIVSEDGFQEAAKELFIKVQNAPRYTFSSSDTEYFGL